MISLNIEKTFGFISKEKVFAYEAEVKAAQEMLEKGTGKGNDFLGWLHLPSSITKEHLADLNATAKVLRDNCEVVIVAGIGGSYLGARAVIEALSNSFTWLQEKKTAPVMIYAGHNISEDYLYELTEYLKDKKFGVINISKSGTTTETALAFRLLKKQCVAGAADMEKVCGSDVAFTENPAAIYAATRNELYRNGKKIEILVNFCPKLHYVSEWWKQLYGESEGKDNKGIFPASVDFSTDLHSMGQWIQEGERSIFETVISVEKVNHKLEVPSDEANLDGLNFLAGKRVDEVNKMAELGTQLAHVDGGVPNMRIVLPELSEYNIGGLLYFFEKACGISGYLLGVNPFNQPGVEAYKKNMFALLDKPGYEEESKAIRAKL